MKNLKRLLSLIVVMAALFVLPLSASAAAASDYSDANDITYYEAVDVLSNLGILVGSDNSYRPTETLTRAEATKIISWLLLGDSAENLATNVAPFDDVPVSHWASGYIAYCSSIGIVIGNGAGSFMPDDEVTGYQFAKMLLIALGYGVNDEYTGSSWSIKVASDASVLGIFDNLEGTFIGSNAITREEMALYAFNTLVGAAQVQYSTTFGDYYTGNSVLNPVDNTEVDPTDTSSGSAYRYTLGYQNFGLVKEVSKTSDDFGRPYYYWTQNGTTLTDDYTASEADYTYTGSLTEGTLYSDLGSNVSNNYTFTYIVDGYTLSGNDGPSRNSATTVGYEKDKAAGAVRGTTTEVYVDDAKDTVTVIIISTYLGVVSDMYDGTTTVEVYAEEGSTLDLEYSTESFAEGDYVLVTMASEDQSNYEIQSLEQAESVAGVINVYGSSYYSVDGTAYYHSGKLVLDEAEGSGDFSSTYTFYLDNQGNIIGVELYSGTASSLNYLYVSDSVAVPYSLTNGGAYVAISADFTDGSSDIVYLRVKNATSSDASYTHPEDGTTTIGQSQVTDPIDAGWYSYTVNSSGYYTLSALNDNAGETTQAEVSPDTSRVIFTSSTGSVYRYATDSTRLVLVDSGRTYTGYTEFPDTTFEDAQVLYVTNSSNRLTHIYVLDDDATSEDVVFAMYSGSASVTEDATLYTFYVDGANAVTYEVNTDMSDLEFGAVGVLEVLSDGTADFTCVGSYASAADSGTAGVVDGYSDYGYVFGQVTASSGSSVTVQVDKYECTFTLDESEMTRYVNYSSSLTSSRPRTGDYVGVLFEMDYYNAVSDTEFSGIALATFSFDFTAG